MVRLSNRRKWRLVPLIMVLLVAPGCSRCRGDPAAEEAYKLFRVHYGSDDVVAALPPAQELFALTRSSADKKMKLRGFAAYFAVLYDLGDLLAAEKLVKDAKGQADKDNETAWSYIYNSEGLIHAAAGRHAMARKRYQQALALAGEDARSSLKTSLLLNSVVSSLEVRDLPSARDSFSQLPTSKDGKKNEHASHAYHLARILRAEGKNTEAIAVLARALTKNSDDTWTWELAYELGRNHEILGDLPAAMAAYQRSIDQVEAARASMKLPEMQAWLSDARRRPYERLFVVHSKSGRTDRALAVLEAVKGRTFVTAFSRLTSRAGSDGPQQRADEIAKIAPFLSKEVGGRDVRLDSSLAGVTFLAYLATEDQLWLVSQVGAQRTIAPLPTPLEALRSHIETFARTNYAEPSAAALGEALLPKSFQPVRGSTVYVVIDGPIRDVPFGALVRGGRRFIADHDVTYVPNLSYLGRVQNIAPADYGAPVVMAAALDLQEARQEAVDVAALLNVAPQLGPSATVASLRAAHRSSLLHFAGHSSLSARTSWLALHDGRVSASSVFEWKLRPRSVVLASCVSAVQPGQDMWGSLAAAFLAGGAHSVVASLRSVPDVSARRFVEAFYAAGGAREPLKAASAARRKLSAEAADPLSWAPFVAFGAPRVRVSNP